MINQLSGLAFGVMLFGIFVGLAYLTLDAFKGQISAGTVAYTQLANVITALGTLVSWLSTVILIMVVAFIVNVVYTAFGGYTGGQRMF